MTTDEKLKAIQVFTETFNALPRNGTEIPYEFRDEGKRLITAATKIATSIADSITASIP